VLNPLLLWFLPLAAVPVLLHLLNLYRLREVELPTYRFLAEGYVRQRRRIRLVEWLLLLLRTAIVLVVVGMLGRPVLSRFGGLFGAGGRDDVIVVDCGITTALVTEGTSALHRAREAARGVVARLPPGGFLTLVRAGMEPAVVHRASLPARPDGQAADRGGIDAELDGLVPAPGTSDLAGGIREGLASPPRGRRTLWVVSDCESRAWRQLADRVDSLQIPADVEVVVVDIGSGRPVRNVAVLGDPPRSQRAIVGLPAEMTLRVQAAGLEMEEERIATVEFDGGVVARVPLSLVPGRTTTHALALTPRRPGPLRGRVSLEADAFPEDDSFVFVLNAEPRVGVLVVAPYGVEPLFDPGLFLAAALESPREAVGAGERGPADSEGRSGPPSPESAAARSLDVTVARSNALGERQIRAADVIFLADTRLDAGRAKWLRERVAAGAGLVIVAGSHREGDRPLRGFTAERIGAAGGPNRSRQGEAPLAIHLGKPVGNLDDERSARGITVTDFSHPVFAAFAGRGGGDPRAGPSRSEAATGDASSLETLAVFRHVPLELGEAGASSAEPADPGPPSGGGRPRVLLRLDDGTPLVVESRLGRGRVIVWGIPFTPDWSNLPVHPAFVPIALRLAQYVRPDPPALAAESLHPHEPAPVRLDDAWRRAVVQATDPGGRRRAIEVVAGDRGATGGLEETSAVGFYEFDIEPPPDAEGSPLRLGMAVNPRIETAALEHLPTSAIAASLAPHPVRVLAGSEADPSLHASLTGRREIWRWLLAVVFGLFGVEFLLSTLRPPAGGPSGEGGWRDRLADWLSRAVGSSGGETSGLSGHSV
jgi:hypothetical protein